MSRSRVLRTLIGTSLVGALLLSPTAQGSAAAEPGDRSYPRPKVTFQPQKVEDPARVGALRPGPALMKKAVPQRFRAVEASTGTVARDGRGKRLGNTLVRAYPHGKAKGVGEVLVAVEHRPQGLAIRTGLVKEETVVELDLGAALTATETSRLVATEDGKPVALTKDASSSTVSYRVAPGEAQMTMLSAGSASDSGDYSATSLSPASSWQGGSQTGSFGWSYPLVLPPSAGGLDPNLAIAYDSGSLDGLTAATNNQASWVGDGFSMEPGFIQRAYRGCEEDRIDRSGASNTSTDKKNDLCWGPDNASIVFNGKSGRLVRVGSTNQYRLEDNSGVIVEKLFNGANGDGGVAGSDVGEHWVATETDGTKYYFGLEKRYGTDSERTNSTLTVPVNGNHAGEPCYSTTFANGFCTQAWKWMLDYVVDVHGNTVTYNYAKETNKYAKNGVTSSPVSYDRAAYLSRIDYGQRAGTETPANIQQRVDFTVAERCLTAPCGEADLTATTKGNWPDTPFDLICASSATTCEVTSPSFFTRKRLTTVTTSYRGPAGMVNVDKFELGHIFPAQIAPGESPLWLQSITRTGLVGGSQPVPPVTFTGTAMANRLDRAGDGGDAMYRYRVTSITTESGGVIAIGYTPESCPDPSPAQEDRSTMRCFPQYWTRLGATNPTVGWFNKYAVATVLEDGRFATSKAKLTTYTYAGPAWHRDDSLITTDNRRTWSGWRGFATVTTTVGDPQDVASTALLKTTSKYFQGMHGDFYKNNVAKPAVNVTIKSTVKSDLNQWAGREYQRTAYNGAAVVGTVYTVPWTSTASPSDAQGGAYRTDTDSTITDTTVSTGTRTTTVTTTSRNAEGYPTEISDTGDTATAADDRCQTITYVPVGAANLEGLEATNRTLGSTCGTAARADGLDVISSTRTTYAPLEAGGAALTGDVTLEERLVPGTTAGTTQFVMASKATYDPLGRVLTATAPSATQLAGRVTTTTYTPADNAPTTQSTSSVTNSQNATTHTTTTTFDPARGSTLSVADPNNRVTSRAYDPLGRTTSIWMANKAAGSANPHYTYAYALSSTGKNVVTAKKLHSDNATYVTSTTILDGLLRQVQTQTPVADISVTPTKINRALTDTSYDSRGLATTTRGPWQDGTGSPEGTYLTKGDHEVPKATYTTFDGAGRTTLVRRLSYGVINPALDTTTTYAGDYTETTPPQGGTPTRTVVDARGQTSALWQYHASPPTGTTAKDITTYGYDNRGNMTSIKDQPGTTWTWDFDAANRMWRSSDPDKGQTTLTFNPDDSTATTTDAKAVALNYSYDDLGRKTAVKKGTANLNTWTYDPTGNLGLPATASTWVGGAEYRTTVDTYSSLGKPSKTTLLLPSTETGLYDAAGYVRRNYYDINGELNQSSMPTTTTMGLPAESWNVARNAIDQPMYLSSITTNGGAVVAGTQRDETGAITQMALAMITGKAVSINQGYEPGTGRLLTQRITRDNVVTPDVNLTYSYDGIGNVKMLRDSPTGATGATTDQQCFTYDYLRRLTNAWANGTVGTCPATPAYTASGPAPYRTAWGYAGLNRTTETRWNATTTNTLTWTYPVATATVVGATTPTPPHAPTKVATKVGTATAIEAAFTYNKDGTTATTPLKQTGSVMTTAANGASSTLTWDDLGRLSTTKYGTGTATTANVYDPEGNLLIKKTVDGGKTLLLGDTEVTYKGTTTTSRRLFTFEGRTVAVRTAENVAGLWFTPNNTQGSQQVQVNASTGAVSKRYYTPFGAPRGTAPGTWAGTGTFLGSAGGTTDSGSDLVHLGARDYDPTNGRFLSVDPVFAKDDPASFSSYNYSNYNPTSFSDPDGRRLIDDTYRGKVTQYVHPVTKKAKDQTYFAYTRKTWTKPGRAPKVSYKRPDRFGPMKSLGLNSGGDTCGKGGCSDAADAYAATLAKAKAQQRVNAAKETRGKYIERETNLGIAIATGAREIAAFLSVRDYIDGAGALGTGQLMAAGDEISSGMVSDTTFRGADAGANLWRAAPAGAKTALKGFVRLGGAPVTIIMTAVDYGITTDDRNFIRDRHWGEDQ